MKPEEIHHIYKENKLKIVIEIFFKESNKDVYQLKEVQDVDWN